MLHVVVAACPKIKLHPLRGFRHRIQVAKSGFEGLVDAAVAAVSAVR